MFSSEKEPAAIFHKRPELIAIMLWRDRQLGTPPFGSSYTPSQHWRPDNFEIGLCCIDFLHLNEGISWFKHCCTIKHICTILNVNQTLVTTTIKYLNENSLELTTQNISRVLAEEERKTKDAH